MRFQTGFNNKTWNEIVDRKFRKVFLELKTRVPFNNQGYELMKEQLESLLNEVEDHRKRNAELN